MFFLLITAVIFSDRDYCLPVSANGRFSNPCKESNVLARRYESEGCGGQIPVSEKLFFVEKISIKENFFDHLV